MNDSRLSNKQRWGIEAILLLALIASAPARAAIVYSNLAHVQEVNLASGVVWDDARIVGGGTLKQVRIWGYNAQSGAGRVFAPNVQLYVFNESTGRPDGTFLASFTATSVTPMAPTEARLIETGDLTSLGVHLPSNARLGIRIATGGNFAIFLYDPPTIGTSEDALWLGVSPAPYSTPGVRNLGFEIVAVPEPHVYALAASALGFVIWRGANRRQLEAAW